MKTVMNDTSVNHTQVNSVTKGHAINFSVVSRNIGTRHGIAHCGGSLVSATTDIYGKYYKEIWIHVEVDAS